MNDDNYALIFGTSLSNTIDLVDLDTFKKFSLKLPVDDMISYNGCCKISDYKYFVHGGHSKKLHKTARIIDIRERSVFLLASDMKLAYHALCLYNENIYCFGGKAAEGSQSSSKIFHLEKKTWTSIQSMPEANCNTTASVINERIFVAGYQSKKIFVYHPIQNKYYITKYIFNQEGFKFLAENWIVLEIFGIN